MTPSTHTGRHHAEPEQLVELVGGDLVLVRVLEPLDRPPEIVLGGGEVLVDDLELRPQRPLAVTEGRPSGVGDALGVVEIDVHDLGRLQELLGLLTGDWKARGTSLRGRDGRRTDENQDYYIPKAFHDHSPCQGDH
jgi:hypothetical protein